ncbi:MAG TPA: hypothetical protein PKA82_14810 [Pyrinomonadaceae bacterium]|nr:hypothetical protein [Pyrinomonadaceae bacterium]
MLAQNFQRIDAETPRRKGRNFRTIKDVVNSDLHVASSLRFPFITFASLLLCVFALNLSCTTKPSDMRTLVPAETLVYLETNDLAAALKPIVDAKPFKEVAKSQPDLSALKGVQLAVAVLGFEATEEKLTDEQSVGSVKPRFVAVADTHSWNSTAVAFAEKKLGGFVAEIYGSEPKLEKSDKHGGKYFAWTAEDKRKAYALVIDGIVYFANDEASIDKCIAVRRGEADSILKTDKIKPTEPGTLARGYVSTDGIAQISGVIGMKLASEASDESEIQSAVAGILPKLIRGTITDINWTMSKGDQGIEDKYQIAMPADVAIVFTETMRSRGRIDRNPFSEVPSSAFVATKYNFQNAEAAWRSIIQIAKRNMDGISGKVIDEFAGSLFEPYGIADPILFFSAGVNAPMTWNMSQDGEKPVLSTVIVDEGKMIRSLLPELVANAHSPVRSLESEILAEHTDATWTIGDAESVRRKVPTPGAPAPVTEPSLSSVISYQFNEDSLSVTFGRESTMTPKLAEIFFSADRGDSIYVSTYLTETTFKTFGMERRTVSDFGLIGQIIAQLADD